MFTTHHKMNPKRIPCEVLLPPTPPLSPPTVCSFCNQNDCSEDCTCDECLDALTPGFAPGETIELDEISLTLLSIREVQMHLAIVNAEVDEWARQMKGLLKAPRTHHVRVFRELSDGAPPYLPK